MRRRAGARPRCSLVFEAKPRARADVRVTPASGERLRPDLARSAARSAGEPLRRASGSRPAGNALCRRAANGQRIGSMRTGLPEDAMPDDKSKRGSPDNKRLNKSEPYEVAYAKSKRAGAARKSASTSKTATSSTAKRASKSAAPAMKRANTAPRPSPARRWRVAPRIRPSRRRRSRTRRRGRCARPTPSTC